MNISKESARLCPIADRKDLIRRLPFLTHEMLETEVLRHLALRRAETLHQEIKLLAMRKPSSTTVKLITSWIRKIREKMENEETA